MKSNLANAQTRSAVYLVAIGLSVLTAAAWAVTQSWTRQLPIPPDTKVRANNQNTVIIPDGFGGVACRYLASPIAGGDDKTVIAWLGHFNRNKGS